MKSEYYSGMKDIGSLFLFFLLMMIYGILLRFRVLPHGLLRICLHRFLTFLILNRLLPLILNMQAIVDHIGLHVLKRAHQIIVLSPILFLACLIKPLIFALDGDVVSLGFNLQAFPISE